MSRVSVGAADARCLRGPRPTPCSHSGDARAQTVKQSLDFRPGMSWQRTCRCMPFGQVGFEQRCTYPAQYLVPLANYNVTTVYLSERRR